MTCAVHCLLTPLLVASVSLGALGWLADEGTELVLLLLMMMVAAVVLSRGWHAHRRLDALGLFVVGLMLIAVGRCLVAKTAEMPLVVAGGLLVALAQVLNARRCWHCPECRTEAEEDRPCGLAPELAKPSAYVLGGSVQAEHRP